MRITCVIGTLGGGGAERVITYLCAGLASRTRLQVYFWLVALLVLALLSYPFALPWLLE